MIRRVLFTVVALVALFGVAYATDRQIIIEGKVETFKDVGKRVALVIGNSNYPFVGSLNNPINDAKEVARVLRQRGFELTGNGAYLDLDRNSFLEAVQRFGQDAVDADVAFFYYSGHGIQVVGTNYLVPTDGKLTRVADAPLVLIDADIIMGQLQASQARLKFVILDACRDNPFLASDSKGLSLGLAQMDAPTGTLISFSTRPGDVAADGAPGGNSPYTEAVIRNIEKPGQSVLELWNQVSLDVLDATRERQQPWIAASGIRGKFFFTPPGPLNIYSQPDLATTQVLKPTPETTEVKVASLVTPVMLQNNETVSNSDAISAIPEARRLLSDRQYEEAHQLLDQMIKADPTLAIAYSFKGYAYLMKAKDMVKEARKGGWKDEEWSRVKSFFQLSTTTLDTAIKLDPLYQPARRHRGNAIITINTVTLERGKEPGNQLTNAIRDLEVAAMLDPTSRTAAASLGIAYALNRNYDQALASFNAATAIDSNYATPYEGRCAVYHELNQQNRAKAEERRAKELASSLQNTKCASQGVVALRK